MPAPTASEREWASRQGRDTGPLSGVALCRVSGPIALNPACRRRAGMFPSATQHRGFAESPIKTWPWAAEGVPRLSPARSGVVWQ